MGSGPLVLFSFAKNGVSSYDVVKSEIYFTSMEWNKVAVVVVCLQRNVFSSLGHQSYLPAVTIYCVAPIAEVLVCF